MISKVAGIGKYCLLQWVSVTILLCIGILIQCSIFVNWDAAWALIGAKRLLQGGSYYHDFFDNNPPMVFYLNTIPIVLTKLLPINSVTALRILVFGLGVGSLWIVNNLLKKIIKPVDRLDHCLFIIFLTFAYFIFPSSAFAEREHIMIMLVLPYLLTVVLQLEKKPASLRTRVVCGLMAGVGFALKPYFLLTIIFVELFIMLKERCFFSWVRIESLIIGSVLVLYFISIFIITPDYINSVLYFVFHFYLAYGLKSWSYLLTSFYVKLFLLTIFLYFFLYKWFRYRCLINILMLATIGFLCSYLIQQRGFFYHALPFVTLIYLLFALMISQVTTNFDNRPNILISSFMIGFMVTFFLLYSLLTVIFSDFYLIKQYKNKESTINHLITYTSSHAGGQPIFFFTTLLNPNPIVVIYAQVELGSRMASMWLLPAISKLQNTPDLTTKQRKELMQLERFQRDIVVQDFKRYQPRLVFVNVSKQLMYTSQPFHYLKFFLKDNEFKKIWQNYHYQTTIWIYDIYQRN